jgi:hypothetical protein
MTLATSFEAAGTPDFDHFRLGGCRSLHVAGRRFRRHRFGSCCHRLFGRSRSIRND